VISGAVSVTGQAKTAKLNGYHPTDEIVYLTTKSFNRALQKAFLAGGMHRKRHDKVKVVLGSLGDPDPFITLQLTNHGETRIKNCRKYDLGDGWRLVTAQSDKVCIFLFVGTHDDTERWLDGHEGESFGVKAGRLVRVPGTSFEARSERTYVADGTATPLIELLDVETADYVLDGLPRSVSRTIEALDGAASSAALEAALSGVADESKRESVAAVLHLLLSGDVDGARTRVDLARGLIDPVEDLPPGDFITIEDGSDVRQLRVGSPEYERWLLAFEKRSAWHDWFLFLHPEQERVVKADYVGAAQLSGVSGSGKTCVVVRRALRLSEAREDARVLVLTLNRSLAGLLRQLVEASCVDEAVLSRVHVTSFFELARDLLVTFEPENARLYEDVTWRLNEHVDEVFREYYRLWANNDDGAVLLATHKSLTARGVSGEAYLREEFDWIRSAVPPVCRPDYLTLERKGRKLPIPGERRSEILQGLEGWERKMRAVGVIDYLGLTSALTRHAHRVSALYDHVLVDESQDFGTTELSIVRRLVKSGPNDVFLCGDVAQTVLPKHRSLSDAGLLGIVRERIQQNYRNSREILAAAYDLLKQNLHEEMFDSPDLEILDPRFANFSGPVPMALAAESLSQELAYARAYAATRLRQGERNVCIALAGFSSRDVRDFAARCGNAALDGAYNPSANSLVFSDLEQTKGYEFDVLIIANCCENVLPSRDAPPEEAFRDSCKLYVAMTRAKRELILSFSGAASPWIRSVGRTIAVDDWSSFEAYDAALAWPVPSRLPEMERPDLVDDVLSLPGRAFLYTSEALDLTLEAQEKLEELVDGKGGRAAGSGRLLRWRTVEALREDLRATRKHDRLLGPRVAHELRERLSAIASQPA
jgi:hypothetical protein